MQNEAVLKNMFGTDTTYLYLNVSIFQKNLQSITLASKFNQWSIRSKLFQLMILFVMLSVAELLLSTFPNSRLHKVFNYKFTMIFSRTYDI